MDLLTEQTLTFTTIYVLVFVRHARRELVHLSVTASPTAAWVWRQPIAATPWARTPRYPVRDRDAVDGRDFVRRARGLGVETVLTPIRAPRANAIAERLVGTVRRECLDHVIILNERHLRAVLTEFVRYSNMERPHRTLHLETPVPLLRARRSDPLPASTRRAAPLVRTDGVTLRPTLRPPQGPGQAGLASVFPTLGRGSAR